MKKKTLIVLLVIAGLSLNSCNQKYTKPLNGVLDFVFKSEVPEKVNKIKQEFGFDENYEKLLDEKEDGVGVYSVYGFKDGTSSEGYGIVIRKDGVWSAFPEICHGKNPLARYDKKRNSLWLTGGVMEGTGVLWKNYTISNLMRMEKPILQEISILILCKKNYAKSSAIL